MAASRRRTLWAAAACCAVVAGLVAALVQLGSPSEIRALRLDRQRAERLQGLSEQLQTFHREEGKLPADVSALADEPWAVAVRRDPETSAPFTYERIDERHFRLCADFARPSAAPSQDQEPDFWRHPQGRHCFDFEVKRDDQEKSTPSESG